MSKSSSRRKTRRSGDPAKLDQAAPRATIGVGQSVGNYTILLKLGEGGMGTVFLAEHPVIGWKVALEVILPQFARDKERCHAS